MTKHQEKEGFKMKIDSRLLYCLMAAMVGFVVRAESHHTSVNTRLNILEHRTDTLESDLKSIKESLYEIRGDVKLLIKGVRE